MCSKSMGFTSLGIARVKDRVGYTCLWLHIWDETKEFCEDRVGLDHILVLERDVEEDATQRD